VTDRDRLVAVKTTVMQLSARPRHGSRV